MTILSYDPSFRALAYSLYDGKDTIYVGKSTTFLGDNIGFDKVFNAAEEIYDIHREKISNICKSSGIEIDCIISEIPPPTAQFSAGLFALDTLLISNSRKDFNPKEIYFVPPSYIRVVHGSKYDKSDSTKLAKYLVNEVLVNDINIVIEGSVSEYGRKMKGRINNDIAESLIILFRAFVRFNIKNLSNTLISQMSGFGTESEKLLYSRI